jgi:phosphohistidine phosphatase
MNLYILRHASAGTKRLNPLLDLKRSLDKEGKRDCLQLSLVLNALKIGFDLIASSPLKRALQTAQLLATETGYESPILQTPALAPTASFADFQRLVEECKESENVLIVGHNPNLSCFTGGLLVRQPGICDAQKIAGIRLRKGSLAKLSLNKGPATLQLLLDPRTVRALYSTSTKRSRLNTSRK